MSSVSLSPLFRRSIGFDRLNDLFDYAMQSEAPNYPPYNIGIARRSFKLSLRLDEHIEVQQADYEDGLLIIELQRIVPEEKLPRQIAIGRKANESEAGKVYEIPASQE